VRVDGQYVFGNTAFILKAALAEFGQHPQRSCTLDAKTSVPVPEQQEVVLTINKTILQ